MDAFPALRRVLDGGGGGTLDRRAAGLPAVLPGVDDGLGWRMHEDEEQLDAEEVCGPGLTEEGAGGVFGQGTACGKWRAP